LFGCVAILGDVLGMATAKPSYALPTHSMKDAIYSPARSAANKQSERAAMNRTAGSRTPAERQPQPATDERADAISRTTKLTYD
jgi:hypothetical protein